MAGTPPPRGWVAPGEVLLHVGLPKTGTTAVQFALADAREELRRRHITYPGRSASHWWAATAMLAVRRFYWPGVGPMVEEKGEWAAIVREVRASPPDWRHVVSAESLCVAEPAQIDRVVGELGPVRVVVGLRALDAQLVSFWQQRVRAGLDVGLDEWLHEMLERDPTGERARSERVSGLLMAELVERWVARVGPDAVTVIVVGGRGRAQLDAFEAMLDLEPGVLQLSSDPLAGNRGLTAEQAAVLVRFNATIDRARTTYGTYEAAMNCIMQSIHRSPASSGSRIVLPSWALPPVRESARASADAIAATGVHIVGDLDDLVPVGTEIGSDVGPDGGPDAGRPTDGAVPSSADLDRGVAAGAEILSALFASGSIRGPHPHPLARWVPPVMVPLARRSRDATRAARRRWRDSR